MANEYSVKLKDYQFPEFRTYDWNNLPIAFTLIMYAIRRSGKTHLLAEIIHTLRHRFEEVYLFSTTSKFSQEGYNYIPKHNRFEGFDGEALKRIINDQERRLQEKLKNPKSPHIKIPKRLLIFDDIVQDGDVRTSEDFNGLFSRGRHIATSDQLPESDWGDFSIVVLSQSVGGKYGIPAVCRRNVDCAICFFTACQVDRELLTDQYASLLDAKIGDAIIKYITKEPYTACILELCNTKARSYEDYIYKYKAKPKIPKFSIGGKFVELRPPESSATIKGREKYHIDIPIAQDTSYFINNIIS